MRTKSGIWVALVGLFGCAPGPVEEELLTPEQPDRSGPAAGREGEPAEVLGIAPGAPVGLPDAVAVWWPEITAAAEHHGVPPGLVALVVWLESNGEPEAVSPAGALGLMQLMPATAAKVAQARGEPPPTAAELFDPERNLELGCAHLSALRAELGAEPLDGAAVHRIAIAYNGGAKVLAAWQRGEPLPAETERYAATLRERWEAREHRASSHAP
jgi:soluble lytic murein transglycosylase-like protein